MRSIITGALTNSFENTWRGDLRKLNKRKAEFELSRLFGSSPSGMTIDESEVEKLDCLTSSLSVVPCTLASRGTGFHFGLFDNFEASLT